MKFLDLIGLTHFFDKVKTWVSDNFLSKKGGLIRGGVSFFPDEGDSSQRIDIEHGSITIRDTDYGKSININDSYISNSEYGDNYLFANGKMLPIGESNGVAGLDDNGNVPLEQLGNLDTTVAEVVTALPTANIKKHIYLVKDDNGTEQDQYEEYIYTGDTSAAYDASKWEKLGDFRATVDLKDYAKNKGTVRDSIDFDTESLRGGAPYLVLKYVLGGDTGTSIATVKKKVPMASTESPGIMSKSDKIKLDGIAENANNYSLPTANAETLGGIKTGYSANGRNYPIAVDNEGQAFVNVPWNDTTYDLSGYATVEKLNETVGLIREHTQGKNNPHGVTKLQVGLGNVDNTSDADKPISTATQEALNSKVNTADLVCITNKEINALFA